VSKPSHPTLSPPGICRHKAFWWISLFPGGKSRGETRTTEDVQLKRNKSGFDDALKIEQFPLVFISPGPGTCPAVASLFHRPIPKLRRVLGFFFGSVPGFPLRRKRYTSTKRFRGGSSLSIETNGKPPPPAGLAPAER